MQDFIKRRSRDIVILFLLFSLVGGMVTPVLADVARIQAPPSLTDLIDVNASNPSDDDSLTWDAATSRWIPGAGGGGGMEEHGNEYHDPDFATEANLTALEGDLATHDTATTGVHGVGAETLLHTGDVGTMAAETATDYLAIADLENPPTENDATTAPTSEWAFDFEAAATDNITGLKDIAIIYVIDAGGSVISTGQKGYLDIPFNCTITTWTLLADQSGSIVIDVWNDTYANFPPTVGDTIAGSEKPTLSTAQKGQDLALGTWTTAVSGGDILAFNVDSCSTITRVTLTITATRDT